MPVTIKGKKRKWSHGLHDYVMRNKKGRYGVVGHAKVHTVMANPAEQGISKNAPMSLIPRTRRVKMVWSRYGQLTRAGQTNPKISWFTIYLNGVCNPIPGVEDHSPYGFDVLSNMYQRYTVINSSIEVQLGPAYPPPPAEEQRDSAMYQTVIQVVPGGGAATVNVLDFQMPGVLVEAGLTTNPNVHILRKKVNMKQLFGTAPMADQDQQSKTDTNPLKVALCQVMCQAESVTGLPAPELLAHVKVTFDVEWFDRKPEFTL